MLEAIKNSFFSWVDSRAPKQPSTLLKQKNIYILPTRYGWLMLGILILILVKTLCTIPFSSSVFDPLSIKDIFILTYFKNM